MERLGYINASEGGPRPTLRRTIYALGPVGWAWAHLQTPSGRDDADHEVRHPEIHDQPTVNSDGCDFLASLAPSRFNPMTFGPTLDSLDLLEVQLTSMKNATLPTMAMMMRMHMRTLWVRSLAVSSN